MRRPFIPALLVLCVVVASCASSTDKAAPLPDDMTALTNLPAEYGELITANYAPQGNGGTGWRELWFENETTGALTYVPVKLPEWTYSPKLVRSFPRPGWTAAVSTTP